MPSCGCENSHFFLFVGINKLWKLIGEQVKVISILQLFICEEECWSTPSPPHWGRESITGCGSGIVEPWLSAYNTNAVPNKQHIKIWVVKWQNHDQREVLRRCYLCIFLICLAPSLSRDRVWITATRAYPISKWNCEIIPKSRMSSYSLAILGVGCTTRCSQS